MRRNTIAPMSHNPSSKSVLSRASELPMKMRGVLGFLTVALISCTAVADSLRTADLPKDMKSILKDYSFVLGDPTWKATTEIQISGVSVFCGSAYFAFRQSAGKDLDCTKLAGLIRDQLAALHKISPSNGGGGGVTGRGLLSINGVTKHFTNPGEYGEAHFADADGDHGSGVNKEFVNLSVRVIPLPDSAFGVTLNLTEAR